MNDYDIRHATVYAENGTKIESFTFFSRTTTENNILFLDDKGRLVAIIPFTFAVIITK